MAMAALPAAHYAEEILNWLSSARLVGEPPSGAARLCFCPVVLSLLVLL